MKQPVNKSDIETEPFAVRFKLKTKQFIEETTIHYLDNFPNHGERQAKVLWQLALAWEKSN